MNRQSLFNTGIAFFVLLLNGCTSITLLRIEELKQVQHHIDSLKVELTQLQEKMIHEQESQNEILRLIRADQQLRFGEFDKRLSSLEGILYESQDRLSQIDKKTLEIKNRWEEQAREDSLSKASKNVEINNLFEIAQNDFSAGRYEIALNGFKDLLIKFPESPRAEESEYWIADCYYARNNYDEAVKRYKEYIKKYSNGIKICVALYKLGLIYDKSNQTKASNMVWSKLISQCPDSEEAQSAKAKMK